jgi:hypothetical protein
MDELEGNPRRETLALDEQSVTVEMWEDPSEIATTSPRMNVVNCSGFF